MPKRTKPPYNPIPPIYGDPPKLNLPDDLFDGIEPPKYSSKYFDDQATVDYFEDTLYPKVRENGKGAVLFPDKEQFLSELDDALLHFDMFRGSVTVNDPDYLNKQRDYFNRLHEAVSGLSEAFAEMSDDHVVRLAHAGIELKQFNLEKHSSHDLRTNIISLLKSTDSVINELKNKNAGRHAELYLLIKQLGYLYSKCSDRKPTITTNAHNSRNKGVFFELVKSLIPYTSLKSSQHITDNSIIEGIKLLNKR